MKRYRVFSQDFDFTANALEFHIDDEWDEDVKALHRQNNEQQVESLSLKYGAWAIDDKIENLRCIGAKACSIVAYHNQFYSQARDAFVIGAYYPALTAACTLGERILNHLVLDLRNEYQHTPEYAEFATMKSCSNWRKMIPALESWGVLLPEAETHFRDLLEVRNRAIHFNPETIERDCEMAIAALEHLGAIINIQFGLFGPRPWFIPEVGGVAPFIRKEWEEIPFVKHFYLPRCGRVGPRHQSEMNFAEGKWKVRDEEDYEDREITDEEFVKLFEAYTRGTIAQQ